MSHHRDGATINGLLQENYPVIEAGTCPNGLRPNRFERFAGFRSSSPCLRSGLAARAHKSSDAQLPRVAHPPTLGKWDQPTLHCGRKLPRPLPGRLLL
jgi:hypothetical protein